MAFFQVKRNPAQGQTGIEHDADFDLLLKEFLYQVRGGPKAGRFGGSEVGSGRWSGKPVGASLSSQWGRAEGKDPRRADAATFGVWNRCCWLAGCPASILSPSSCLPEPQSVQVSTTFHALWEVKPGPHWDYDDSKPGMVIPLPLPIIGLGRVM